MMMHVVLKAFLGCFCTDLWTSTFSFWEILTHICHCLILIKNKLYVHICLPNFRTNIKIVIKKTFLALFFVIFVFFHILFFCCRIFPIFFFHILFFGSGFSLYLFFHILFLFQDFPHICFLNILFLVQDFPHICFFFLSSLCSGISSHLFFLDSVFGSEFSSYWSFSYFLFRRGWSTHLIFFVQNFPDISFFRIFFLA